MRTILTFLASLLIAPFMFGFVVTVPFPRICEDAEVIAIVRVEAKAGRNGWDASVTECIYGTLKPGNVRLNRVHPEPDPHIDGDDVIYLSPEAEVRLEVGTSYLAFLRWDPESSGFLPAASRFDSYFQITENRIEGLITNDKKKTASLTVKDAIGRIQEALKAIKKNPTPLQAAVFTSSSSTASVIAVANKFIRAAKLNWGEPVEVKWQPEPLNRFLVLYPTPRSELGTAGQRGVFVTQDGHVWPLLRM